MYISRVVIDNFRNFKHLAVNLNPTTVIVGENKVGKSNFLNALRLVLDPTLPDASRKLHLEDFWDGLGLKDSFAGKEIKVVVEFRGFEGNPDERCVLSDNSVKLKPPTARMTYVYRKKQAVKPKAELREDDYEYSIFGGLDEKHRLGSDVFHWVSLTVLPALRDAEGEIQNWRRSPLRPLIERLRIDDKRLVEASTAFKTATDKLRQEDPIQTLEDGIGILFEEIAGVLQSSDLRLDFVSTRPEKLLRSLRLFIDGDRSRSLGEASLGMANALYFVLYASELNARKQAKETVATLLAIEEPEAHLHPQMQRLVFGYFFGQGSPLLVTTHSPQIASVAPIESLVYLTAGTQGTIAAAARDLQVSASQKKDIERYLDVTRAEMLFARAIMLVEGPAELFLIPVLARHFRDKQGKFINLDKLGITVCSVHGTDFAPYHAFLSNRGLNIPHVILTDGDPKTEDGATKHYGVIRAISLLENTVQQDISNLMNNGEWASARCICAKNDIFIGCMTLELDLLQCYGECMKKAYAELVDSQTSAANFGAKVDQARLEKGQISSAANQAVLDYINRVGKGRFAQRLASHLEELDALPRPPDYIANALERIVSGFTPNA